MTSVDAVTAVTDVDEVVEIERIEIVEVVEPGHNDFLKKRRSIIIASIAVGCFILFALSVLISSRVSCICSKPDRKKNSKKISTNVLSTQIQRELANASNI